MKKIFLPLSILVLIISGHLAAEINFKPNNLRKVFSLYFSNVKNLQWKNLEDGEFKASFVQKNIEMEVYFHSSGELKKIDKEIGYKELPAGARLYISSHFKNAHINNIRQNQDENVEAPYVIEISKKNRTKKMYFTRDGKLAAFKRIS